MLKAVDIVVDTAPGTGRLCSVITLATGITVALVLDYSLFSAYGVALREGWMGPVVTGLVVGSFTAAWQAVFGWLGRGSGPVETADRRSGRPRIAA
ncbi:MAG: hypothetical protein ACT4OS_04270 [Acidimicrobiales bacterium]